MYLVVARVTILRRILSELLSGAFDFVMPAKL